jgi:predicted ATPase
MGGARRRLLIVLTGGPGGGKTALIHELQRDPEWAGRFVALPEAIAVARRTGISTQERSFQRLMVEIQVAMEEALDRTLGVADARAILCHRGSLDPLAYWLRQGWPEDEFFTFTHTSYQEHYRRYTAVIHMVTAAQGALHAYRYWPAAHRGETPQEAAEIDHRLAQAWGRHPGYVRIGNEGQGWTEKSATARRLLADWLVTR